MDSDLKKDGVELWTDEKLSLFRLAFALMFAVAGMNVRPAAPAQLSAPR